MLAFIAVAALSSPTSQRLRDPVLHRLQTGATKPTGWLKDELTLQAKGISGQLPYFWHYLNWTTWMDSPGKDPAGREGGGGATDQFIPYYLNGLIPLSYQLDDANLAALRDNYIATIIGNQRTTGNPAAGWLGTQVSQPTQYWDKYFAIEAIESFAEAEAELLQTVVRDASAAAAPTSAKAVAALIAHHRQFWNDVSGGGPAFNQSKWGFARSSDAIVGIQWLIDNGHGATSDTAFLWDLMSFIRTQSDAVMSSVSPADGGGFTWEEWFTNGDPFTKANDGEKTKSVHLRRHGVDIGQAIKTGALYWRSSGDAVDYNNPYTALMWSEKYLHMADGMYFADEEVTYGGGNGTHNGGHTAGRGTETCSVVETMFSMRTAYEITGNITFMDRLERLAFNSLPAALWPDATANVYHHSSNQLTCGGQYGFNLFYCCTANVHQGWPKFMLSAVQVTNPTGSRTGSSSSSSSSSSNRAGGSAGTTVVVSGYSPSTTSLPNDGGVLNVSGSYPFSDTVLITASKDVTLALRIPCWSESALVTIGNGNGAATTTLPTANKPAGTHMPATTVATAPACAFYNVSATAGVPINLTFVNKIWTYTWKANTTDGSYSEDGCGSRTGVPCGPLGGGIEVHRGPLSFALRPDSTVEETTIGCIGGHPAGRYGWNCSGITPQFPNIKSRNVQVNGTWAYAIDPSTFEFVADSGASVPAIPFSVTDPPAVKITVKAKTLPQWSDAGRPPHSPLTSSTPFETIELVPFGATNIRISVFPQLLPEE